MSKNISQGFGCSRGPLWNTVAHRPYATYWSTMLAVSPLGCMYHYIINTFLLLKPSERAGAFTMPNIKKKKKKKTLKIEANSCYHIWPQIPWKRLKITSDHVFSWLWKWILNKRTQRVLASEAHILKLEQYRED